MLRCLDDDVSLSDFVSVSADRPSSPDDQDNDRRRICTDRVQHDRHLFLSDPRSSSSLYVVFKSNHLFEATGFEARYHFKRAGSGGHDGSYQIGTELY